MTSPSSKQKATTGEQTKINKKQEGVILRVSLHKQRHAIWQQRINISFLLPFFILLTSVVALFVANIPTQAVTSSTLNFQGRLLSSTGSLVPDGSYNIEFKIYDDPTAGTNYWIETRTGGSAVTVKNGYFSVYLGSVTPFGGSIPWDQELYMTMNVNGDGEMTPRFKLTAVPYAFRAGALVDSSGNAKTADDFIQKSPATIQAVNSALAAIRLNQAGAGGFIEFQKSGDTVFAVGNNGETTLGSSTQQGQLTLEDGNGNNTTLIAGNSTTNLTFTLPSNTGISGQCLKTDGLGSLSFSNCATGGAGGGSSFGPYTFDADNDADESAWTFISDFGTNGLNASGTTRAWSHDVDDTPSADVGPTSGQGGNPDGFVYTEASAPTAAGDTFTMTHNTAVNAATSNWGVEFYWNQRGNDNLATVEVQTNENSAGWVTRGTYGTSGPNVATAGAQVWNYASLDLTGVVSDSSTQIRLLVTLGTTGNIWNNDFGIDTISLIATPIGGGGGGTPFVQNGNTFGATAKLGTSDLFGLDIITNNVAALSFTSTGAATFTNGLAISSGGLDLGGGNISNINGLTATTISGDGSGITDINGTNIVSGTINDLRLSANIAKLDVAQTFNALQTFDSGLVVGNTSSAIAGAIRWNGTDFEGYDGLGWISLTQPAAPTQSSVDVNFVSSLTNLAGTINAAPAGLLAFTSGTAVSSAAGSTTFVAPADGSFRSCLVVGNANRTAGSATLRWRVNGVSVGGGACVINASNVRTSTGLLDPGVVTFNAGDVIGVAFDSAGLTPAASVEYTAYWSVDYNSSLIPSNAFVNGGNSFAGTAELGTNDNNGLRFITNGINRFTISASGLSTFENGIVINSGGIDNNYNGLTEVGALTGVSSVASDGGLTLQSAGGSDIILNSGSGVVSLASSTLRRASAGTTTIDLLDNSGGTTLSIINSDGTQIAGLSVEGSVSASGFSGNGSGLSSLDGSSISTGTVADARLSSNVDLLDQNQTISGLKTFSSGLILGDSTSTTSGAIRWSGTDFEGYDGIQWVSLTGGGGGSGPLSVAFIQAYDNTGGTDLNSATPTAVPWDTETKKDSGFTHDNAVDNTRVYLDDAGWYKVSYNVSGLNGSGNRNTVFCQVRFNGTTYNAPSGSYSYGRNNTDAGATNTSSVYIETTAANEYYEVMCSQSGSSGPQLAVAGSSWTVAEKTTTISGGGLSFEQGGNDFGANGILGTTTNYDLNFITNNSTALSLTTTNQAIFTGEILANGGLTIGNASGDGLTIVSDSVTVSNGLNFDSGTFVIDSTNNRVGIGTATTNNLLTINDANTADSSAQVLLATGVNTNKGLVIQGESSQTANLFELQNDSGVLLGGFNSGGGLVLGLSTITSSASGSQTVNFGDESGTVCLSGSTNCGFLPLATGSFVTDGTANDTIAINKTGASGNLLALQKSGGAVFTVANTGSLQIQSTDSAALDIRNVGGTSFFSINTSTGQVQVGSSTADAVGVLFVLDTKNTSGDPTGVNGAQYYNSSSDKFRCFQNGLWQDCLTAGYAQYNFIGGLETWSNQPAADTEFLNTQIRQLVDLTTAREFRFNIVRAAGTVNAGADCRIQYSTAYAGVYANLDGGAGPEVDISGTAELKTSGWASITGAAKSDVYLRIVCKDGNGAQDPQFRSAAIQIR